MIAGNDSLEAGWRWWSRIVASAVVVVGLHTGLVAYAYMHPPEEEIEETEGAFMMELAPLPVVAAAASSETPGPMMETTQPKIVEKTPTEEVPDVTPPKEDPLPIAPDPELAMPIAKPVEEPKAEKEEEKPVEQAVAKEEEKKKDEEPDTEKAKAQEAKVQGGPPPAPTADVAEKSAAPVQGTTDRKAYFEMSWGKAVAKHLGRFPPRYPADALKAGHKGEAVVAFRVDRRGQVISARVTKTSKSVLLDKEAVALLHRAEPLPKMPDEMPGESFEFVIPVHFRMK
jgi:periplasmic protein TonB